MANYFIIPETAYDGLEALLRIGDEKLQKFAEGVARKSLSLDVATMVADLAKETGAEVADLEEAVDHILTPLSGLRGEFRMSGADFVILLTDMLEQQNPKWYEANRANWASVALTVGSLIGPNSFFAQLNKAYRLLVNRPALVDTVRMLTDLRPVYDDEATEIQAYLIATTMAVSYQEFGESKRVHLTLDKRDLERLQEQVDRALRKIRLLEKQVALLEVPPLVAGTERS